MNAHNIHHATLALLLAGVVPMCAKTARTFYSDAKVAVMRENLERYDWARSERDAILKRVAHYLDWDERRLRALVPPPEVPRAYVVHESGCPVHGAELNKLGRYSWQISPDKPWQVQCPVGGELYPSNDFAAYLASGMKDRSLVTGDYADDGWGWTREGEPKKFWFVGCYAHWLAYRILLPALRDLGLAYVITDDERYANADAVLLRQLAEYYPRYQYEEQSRYGTEFNRGYYGRLLYHTWECFTVHAVAPAYDAVWPALNGQDRAAIEERLLRQMARDITDGSHRIQGNYGMHHKGLTWLALVLDDDEHAPASKEMIDWVLNNNATTLYTDMGFTTALYNIVHRDGYPFESPSYNVAWNRDLSQLADALVDAGISVYELPRFRKLLHWPLAMACAGEFTPPLGDSNNMFAAVLGWRAEYALPAFRQYRTPEWAKALQQANAKDSPDLFAEPLDDAIEQAAKTYPTAAGVSSSLMPGIGFASLQTGNDRNRTAVSVFYGYYAGHRHCDRLHIDLFSHRHSLLPDFGYPETADSYDPRRSGFFEHTVTHNTVMVNATKQTDSRGRLHVFDPGAGVQLVEVAAESAYPEVARLYRRTLILVDAEPDKAFVVDIFRVRGGHQHDYLLHGTQADFTSALALSAPQAQGTLAGEDVPYACFYDDPDLRGKPVGTVRYHGYMGSGFQFLFNAQRAALERTASAEWRLNRDPELYPHKPTAGVVLRAHLIGADETVIVADGKPQNRKTWPATVKWLIRRRAGTELESVFVTVFEPYSDKPFISELHPLPVAGDGLAIALSVSTGASDFIIVNQLADPATTAVRLETPMGSVTTNAAAVVLQRQAGGEVTPRYVLDGAAQWGSRKTAAVPTFSATVKAVDYERGQVTVDARLPAGSVAGGSAIVSSPLEHAAAVPVAAVVDASRFSVGDDDLTVGLHEVVNVDGHVLEVNPPFTYFVRPGMTAVNEAGQVIGRLKGTDRGRFELTGRPLNLASCPDLDGDGRRSVRFMVIGPGDTVTLHYSTRSHPGGDLGRTVPTWGAAP